MTMLLGVRAWIETTYGVEGAWVIGFLMGIGVSIAVFRDTLRRSRERQ